jgi:RNA polymerase sigma-70 factor (ECF subfamily)
LVEITRNAIHDFHRKSKRTAAASIDGLQEPLAPAAYDPEPFAELRSTIAGLPEKERMALHLYYLDEQPVAAAKQILSLSQSGFYKVLNRARELLFERLTRTDKGDR